MSVHDILVSSNNIGNILMFKFLISYLISKPQNYGIRWDNITHGSVETGGHSVNKFICDVVDAFCRKK